MKYFVISDTHFGHANIIKYCNRPFADVEEMDKQLIKNWNSIVSKDDTVIHLGDIGLGSKTYIKNIVSQLNGDKILIKGNHDNWSDDFYREAGFKYVSRYPIVWNDFYLLSHIPLQLFQNVPYKNIFGHVHDDPLYQDTDNRQCVCVERTNYKPVFLIEK